MLEEVAVRQSAFDFLAEKTEEYRDILPRSVLQGGFQFRGHRIPLVGPQGIFKPQILEFPLSITTAPPSDRKKASYSDYRSPTGFLQYCYRGTDPAHRENEGLRQCMKRKFPLVYFLGIDPGRYLAKWPVFIIGDNPGGLSFQVSIEDEVSIPVAGFEVSDSGPMVVKAYRTRGVQIRLHQRAFRERVLSAYHRTCSLCNLKHEELLEAAHILPDGDPRSQPVVSNGIALCNLHHAAFDQKVLGIRPDLTVAIRADVLEEEDGPMLLHGLQGFHGKPLSVPAKAGNRPNAEFIAERYAAFLRAS
jgi:putative restriction endonuclease